MTIYPDGIDSSTQLPITVDNITPVKSDVVNRLRDSIIAIESELGIQPSGTFSTVRARLDALDSLIESIVAGGSFAAGGDLSGTNINQIVIGIQGISISDSAPADTYVLAYSAATGKWEPSPREGITVDSLSISPSIAEVNQTVATPSFTATYSDVPTTAELTDNAGSLAKDITSTPNSFTSNGSFQKTSFGGSVTFTDTATLSATSGTRSVTLSWGQRNYWGVGAAGQTGASFITSLASSAVRLTRAETVSVTASSVQKIYYASRTAYGTPIFKDHATGFAVAITKSGDYSVTNSYGFAENYQLWESDNLGLGTFTMDVT